MLKTTVKSLIFLVISCFILSSCAEDKETKYAELVAEADKYITESNFEYARLSLMSAIDIKPKEALNYYKLAEVQLGLGNLSAAVDNYKSTINYDKDHRDARVKLASIFLMAKQVEFADDHIRNVLEKDPNDVEAQIVHANILSLRGDYENAKEILNKIVSDDPKSVPAIASLAQVYMVESNYQEAEEYLVKALAITPDSPPMRLALSDLYARQGRLDEAEKIMTDLVKGNENQSGFKYLLGEFLLKRGDGTKALEQYENTIKLSPGKNAARDRLYDMYVVRGELDKAKSLTKDLEAKDPKSLALAYFKGRDMELDGKPREAYKFFIDAIRSLNNFSPVFRRAGKIELRAGKLAEGFEHLSQAVAINPKDTGARMALGRYFFSQGEIEKAYEESGAVLSLFPKHFSAFELRADAAFMKKDYKSAENVYRFFVERFPEQAGSFFKLGLALQLQNKHEEAITYFRKALDFDQSVLSPARRLSQSLIKTKGMDAAISEVRAYSSKSKKNKGEFNFILASLLLAKDHKTNITEAKKLFELSLEQNPNLLMGYLALASLDAQTGDKDSAILNYEKYLETNPKSVPTMMLLAIAKEQKGEMAEVEALYRKIVKLAPTFAPALNNLAWIVSEKENGDLDEALSFATKAKEQLTDQSVVSDTLGWIYYKRGSNQLALQYLEEALEQEKAAKNDGALNPEILFHYALAKKKAGALVLANSFFEKAKKTASPGSSLYKRIIKELN